MSTDPTRIKIETDPTKKRMSGIATHGETPFDCEIISHIEGNLWQGGCEDGLILPSNFKHLISLYPWERYTVKHELKSATTVKAYDSDPAEIAGLLDGLASWVIACMEDGPTLVHCQAGLNRSGLLAALVLMRKGRTAQEAIDLLRETRSPAVLCNRAFVAWLQQRDISKKELKTEYLY